MTNPRILIPHRLSRFRRGPQGWEIVDPRSQDYDAAVELRFDADDWAAIEAAAGLGALSQEQRAEGARVALLYVREAENHRLGMPVDRFAKLTPRQLHSLGFPSDPAEALLHCVKSWPPAESFALFVNGLGALYEEASGQRRSVRNDHDETSGAEGFTPFVRFVHAIWLRLPIANRKSRSLSQMAARINRHFRLRGKSPKWGD